MFPLHLLLCKEFQFMGYCMYVTRQLKQFTQFFVFVVAFSIFIAISLPVISANINLGNNLGNAVTFFSVPKDVSKAGSAIRYSASLMQAYSGNKIVSVSVWARISSGDVPMRIFIAGSMDGSKVYYEQETVLSGNGWNEVRLETPFFIDGSELYVGYEATGIRDIPYSVQLVDGDEYVLNSNDGWQPCDNGYSAAMYVTVEGESLPQNNITLTHITMPDYVLCGQPLHFDGTYVNVGMTTVESLSVKYSIGDSIAYQTISVSPVKPRTKGSFSLDGFAILQEGKLPLRIDVTSVNAETDFDMSDNSSRTKQVLCKTSFPQRKVLLEMFSTERCPNCPDAHDRISAITDTCENIIEMVHHAGFYEDDFTIGASKEYEWFYRESRLYAPAMMIDRTSMADNYPTVFTDGVPVISASADYLRVLYNDQKMAPAFVTVRVDVEAVENDINIHVEGEKLLDSDSSSPRLFVFITEDSIYTTQQSGASKGYYHRYVARHSVTPTWGEPVSLDGYSADYTIPFDTQWNRKNLNVVAFVANYDEADKNNCRVLNSETAHIPYDGSVAGIFQQYDEDIATSWDGKKLVVPGGFDILSVYDLSGRLLLTCSHSDYADLACLSEGYYVVKFAKDRKQAVVKVSKK